MVVEHLARNDRIRQTIHSNSLTSDTYVRTYTADGWGEWFTTVSKTQLIQTANTNLNNYKAEGRYYFPGSYTPLNVPEGLVNGWLEVFEGDVSIKQIWHRFGTLNTNDWQIYVRTFSSVNSTWSNWKKIGMEGKILYDGGQTLDNITLNDSVTNYDYIEIFYKMGNTAHVGSKKINVTSDINTLNLILDGVFYVNDFVQPFSSVITINDKTLTRVRTGGVNIKTTTNAISSWTGNVYITKVVGYKN